jgi:hypothetical protein
MKSDAGGENGNLVQLVPAIHKKKEEKVVKKIVGVLLMVSLLLAAFPAGVLGAEANTDAVCPVLAVKNPDTAVAGRPVPVQVVEANTGRPIASAGVWAINVKELVSDAADAKAYADAVDKIGRFLGKTNNRGYVSPFPEFEVGKYVLVAIKHGCIPGFSRISIVPVPRLVITAPDRAPVKRPVSIRVTDSNTGTPVGMAGVWAVEAERAPAVTAASTEKYAEVLKDCGKFLGWTNRSGYVAPAPVFGQPGEYVLVAIKSGYLPGFDKIILTKLMTATAQPVSPAPSLSAARRTG